MDKLKKLVRIVIIIAITWVVMCGCFVLRITLYSHKYDRNFDNIVVLTGDSNRIAYAFASIDAYKPKTIFISGVHEKTTLGDILQNQEKTKSVRIILGKQAKNTRENACEIDNWVKQSGISEILLITSDYHIQRSIIELKCISKKLKIYPCAVKSNFDSKFLGKCVKEFHKIIYVHVKNSIERIKI